MIIPNMVKAFGSQSIEFGFQTQSDVRLKIAKSHMNLLDQPSNPCKKDLGSQKTSKCIAKFVEDQIGCGIKLHGNSKGLIKMNTCKSALQLKKLAKILWELNYADEKTIYELTGCLASCVRHEYQGLEFHRSDWAWKSCKGILMTHVS